MYEIVTCEIRDKKEVMKHYPARYGAPGMEREPKEKKTPEEMAKQNQWRKCRDLRRAIELNFEEGDLHVVLTCRKEERPAAEEAPGVIRAFRDKLRAAYKKRGWDLKYVITCEVGARGAVHWHMIVNNEHDAEETTTKILNRLWTRGRVYFSSLDGSGDYGKLAEYIVKETDKRIREEGTAEKLSYMSSRNLVRPQTRTEKVMADRWRKVPKPPKGWYLVPGTLVNGVNKFTGLPYQHYTIRKEAEKGAGRKHKDGG